MKKYFAVAMLSAILLLFARCDNSNDSKKRTATESPKKDNINNLVDADKYDTRGGDKELFNDYEGAIADYDKAIELVPDYVEAYYNRGAAKYNLEDYKGVVADWEKVIRLDPFYKVELQPLIDDAKQKIR